MPDSEVDRLNEELRRERASSISKRCPSCKGEGFIRNSDEGGLERRCDCAGNLADALDAAKKEIEALKKAEGLLKLILRQDPEAPFHTPVAGVYKHGTTGREYYVVRAFRLEETWGSEREWLVTYINPETGIGWARRMPIFLSNVSKIDEGGKEVGEVPRFSRVDKG